MADQNTVNTPRPPAASSASQLLITTQPIALAPLISKPTPFWSALNEPTQSPIRQPMSLDQRIRRLEVNQAAIIRAINAGTLTIVCNEDSTITGEIDFPDFPSSG